jgi:hypothetical protein
VSHLLCVKKSIYSSINKMSGTWSSGEAFPFGAAPATGGRRRHSRKHLGVGMMEKGGNYGYSMKMGGRRRHTMKMEEGGRRRMHKTGGEDVAPPSSDVKEDAQSLAAASMPKTMDAGKRRHTKAKKVAKALLKLSKKLEKGGRRHRKN